MSPTAIIERALQLGVSLRVEGSIIKAKGPGAAIAQLLPELKERKTELLRLVSNGYETGTHDPDVSGHWLIIKPLDRIEMYFSPPATRQQLAERFPGALLVCLRDEY